MHQMIFCRRGVHWRRISDGALALGLLLVVTGCSSSKPAPDCAGLVAGDAWVQPAHAGSREMTGYLTLRNQGASDVLVTGVSSSQFDRAVFQQKAGPDGQEGVTALAPFVVSAGDHSDFTPDNREIALYSPTQSYDPGDQIEIVLACGSEHASLSVAAVVRSNAHAAPDINKDIDSEADTREQIIRDAKDGGGDGASDDSKTAH